MRHRRRQAARRPRPQARRGARSAAARTPSWRSTSPSAIAQRHDATLAALHIVPPGITLAVRAQAERALTAFVRQHVDGQGRHARARGLERPRRDPARGRPLGHRRHGRRGADRDRRHDPPLRRDARGDRHPLADDGRRRQDARVDRAPDVRAAGDPRRDPRRRRPRRGGIARRARPASSAGSASRTSTTTSSPTCAASTQLKEKQGLTVSLVLPTLNEEETIGPIVRRAIREMVGRVPLLDEVLVIDSASTDRTREIAEAEGARVVQHPDVLSRYGQLPGQGRGALEVALRDLRRPRRLGRHGRPELAPADGLRDPRAAAPRAAPAVRQGLLPAPDRAGRRPPRGRRRPGHGARRAAAHQPLLPGAVRVHPAARPASTPGGAASSSRSRSSPATRSRSGTSSTSRSAPGSTASARSTSSGGSTATRSSRACRGCRS